MKNLIVLLLFAPFHISAFATKDEEKIMKAFIESASIFPRRQVSSEKPPFPIATGHIVKNQPAPGKVNAFQGCSVNTVNLKVGDHGRITSPNYPKNYTYNSDCVWHIEGKPGTKIEAVFFDFVTQPWFYTFSDYVHICKDASFDHVDTLAGDLNDQTPFTITSRANKLGIRFHSSSHLNFKGFKLEFIVKSAYSVGLYEPTPFDGTCGRSFLLEPKGSPTAAAEDKSTARATRETAEHTHDDTTLTTDYFSDLEAHIPDNTKIVGNNPSPPHAYPWMVALLIDEKLFCGGTVIDNRHILTAAHCTKGATTIHCLLGSTNFSASAEAEPYRKVVKISKENIFTHPNFDNESLSDDISILRLPQEIKFSDQLRPICLPNRYQLSKTFNLESVEVSGWGKTADNETRPSNTLQVTSLSVLSNKECRAEYPGIITGNQICTATTSKSSPCQGDSGGPLFIRQTSTKGDYYLQIGIASFSTFTCEGAFPVGFTRLTAFLDYIQLITGRKFTHNDTYYT